MAATETSTRAAAALDDLYRHHVGEVYRYTYAVLGNHADAEDVTQTTFVNALRALERGEEPRNSSAWLIAIAQNVVRQRWRQAAARPAEVELDRDVPVVEGEEEIEVDELVRALQRIPPSQREALVMRELEGRSYNEIAGVARAHDGGARDAALPRAAIAGRGARESRHLPERAARTLEAARRTARAEGATSPRRAPRRVPGLRAARRGAEATAESLQGARGHPDSGRARALQGRAERVRRDIASDHRACVDGRWGERHGRCRGSRRRRCGRWRRSRNRRRGRRRVARRSRDQGRSGRSSRRPWRPASHTRACRASTTPALLQRPAPKRNMRRSRSP